MDTQVSPIDPTAPQPERIAQAAAVLRRGGLVAFPTETVYGLGANALDATAVAGIFLAKGRPTRNPLIVHVAEVAEVTAVASAWPALAAMLAAHFWPGPLTLILPRREAVPDTVTGGGPTVAVRVPAHAVARALIRAAGVPIAAPSANRSSQLSPTRAEHVLRSLAGRIDLVLDGGPTLAGIESTILDVTTSPPRLLRPGPIGRAALEALIGPIASPPAFDRDTTAPLPSPGLLSRHYAPRTPLEVCVNGTADAAALAQTGVRVGLLTFAELESDCVLPGVRVLTLPANPAGYAAELYTALHILDDADLQRILVTLPPQTADWLAIHDRLSRASS